MSLISDHYTKSTVYRMNSRRQRKILELLPSELKDKRILDCGAASGYFSKILTERGAHVTAIDISVEAITLAKKYTPDAFVVDIESGDGKEHLAGKTFDYIILGEVIEHLFDPERALIYLGSLLEKGGLIIITTPNILLWSHRLRFLGGTFEYADTGVFDHGHLHFFTHRTLMKTVKKLGFEIVRENHDIHPNWFEPYGKHFPNLFAFQLIMSIRKVQN
jgi:2-polyprenyl-3-methyl-5-hydroxy-6-metoxy-1,4-benzoquinol methylase